MFRKSFFLIIMIVVAIAFAGCGSKTDGGTASVAKEKVKIVATIYPVYEFARQVGGDKVEVTMLIPPGAEPHDWEPTAKDLVKIRSAKLLLYNGAGFEPVDKLLKQEVLGSAIAVEVSKGIPLLQGIQEDDHDEHEHEHNHNKAKQDDKHQHETDPHVWLDPELAKLEVDNIAAALSKADPANGDFYQQNANRYKDELTKLDGEFAAALTNVSRRDIVTTHAAFQYLTKRYKLNQIAIMGLAPDAEPTSAKLVEIVKFCRDKQVTTIFFETLISPRVAQTIAKETGAKLLVLHPIDGLTAEDVKSGKDYLSLMRDNLTNIKIALQ